ncbi:MAG TPA: ATP-binding cassette domain-containing protein [Acidimicrobiales bacterium]|nr:ATP-binding cassette domain-containing protein [Acidimicrobiales bacterium]
MSTAAGAPGAPVDRPVLVMRGAAAAAGGRTLWSGVDLEVGAGEFVAVLGPNGAGKSTLVKVALGLLPLTAGSVELLGRPAGSSSRRVGYLPQRRSFDPGLAVRGRDVVRLGLDGHRWGVPFPLLLAGRRREREARTRVGEVVDLVGASAYADRPIGSLSGGEQQRLLIAQALVERPEILFLDEPLDSLDLPNQAAVASLIGGICRDSAVAVVMVAHDVNPILGQLDRVVYIAGGRVAAGSPHEVITSETLSALFSTPIEVVTTSDGRLVVVGEPEAPEVHGGRHGHEHR